MLPASFPKVIAPSVGGGSVLGTFWFDGLAGGGLGGCAGILYHLKSGLALRNASLYCLASSV